MPDRDSRKSAILRPAAAMERIEVGRSAPPASLAGYVDYAWWVTWDAPQPYLQEVIPRPVVHVSAEWHAGVPRLIVHGVHSRRFDRLLHGRGRTVAVAFRPAGFRPFLDAGVGVGSLRDREVPAGELLGLDDRPIAHALVDPEAPLEDGVAALTYWLEQLLPEPDPWVGRLAALVERAETDTSLTRAEQLAELAGVGLRTLQRRFVDYVGIGPKWVVQRCRLLDVAAAANARRPVDWALLAADLGYADQSHLIRAFTSIVGHPPGSYARG